MRKYAPFIPATPLPFFTRDWRVVPLLDATAFTRYTSFRGIWKILTRCPSATLVISEYADASSGMRRIKNGKRYLSMNYLFIMMNTSIMYNLDQQYIIHCIDLSLSRLITYTQPTRRINLGISRREKLLNSTLFYTIWHY